MRFRQELDGGATRVIRHFGGFCGGFADILMGEGITYAETKHCAANTEAYTLTGNNTYGNETLRRTTIQNKYCIQCVSQHTQLWLYSGKAVGLASPQREHFAGISIDAANIQETYLSYLPILPYLSTYLPYTSYPTFYPNLSAIFPLSYDAIDAIPWRH